MKVEKISESRITITDGGDYIRIKRETDGCLYFNFSDSLVIKPEASNCFSVYLNNSVDTDMVIFKRYS